MTSPTSTRYGRDVRSHIPKGDTIDGYLTLSDRDAAIWERAAVHLNVRNNDSHTLYAYGIARALLAVTSEADDEVVLPAILLHDTGWSTVAEHEILEAIAPGGGRPDLVRKHEIEGARIARGILSDLGYAPDLIDRIVTIIDGHDSRLTSLSIEDAIVKDADKLWRVTPHGIATVCGWFDLTQDESLRITAARVQGSLFTDAARTMARTLTAIASIDLAPQRHGLG
ncbi:HD domain-containing protein [Diaminobutyricimonas sp. TR449]|uniref:HD domain-containing protein n=1 Tax=Diaminobutyricimonas sp. TR449 TaxID=2708076 RepID=UPI001421FF38|nr:HD domain-containing protein [Diaminobutyricimonas sp. TR449]